MSNKTFISLSEWFPQYSVLHLWTDKIPNHALTPQFSDSSMDKESPEREISQISNPEMMVVEANNPNGTGVLIIPGGSYKRVALDKEGVDTARVLSEKGYTVFVMTYRMPADGHNEGNLVSLADAQRAMRLIRSQAERWPLAQLGVIGFSAGGHVAAHLATRYELNTYIGKEEYDALSARPDFVTLMYPVISMDTTFGHPGSRFELLGQAPSEKSLTEFSMESQVHTDTPPCLLIHACDDLAVKAENSILFWQALKAHNVPVEMHLFECGGHGFGIRDSKSLPVETWPNLFDSWVKHTFKEY